MYPMYGHMDSYPHQRPYAPYYQNIKQNPYPMKPDVPKSHSPYEIYPCGFNSYYHPHPMEFHGCCNHNYFPNSCAFHPPYFHFPPPQPFHFHGNYFPHSHYPIDMPPRYDYDKNTPRDHHCCGCPNHSCTSKENRILKEEPDPDSDKTTDTSENYSYPVVWIPPGFLKKEEEEKEKSAEVGSKGKEGNENSKSDEGIRSLNRLFPLDMKKLESLMQGGGEKNRRNEEDQQFPSSIFSVPSDSKQLETNGPEEKKLPSKLRMTPVNTVENEDYDSVQNIPKKTEMQNHKGTQGTSRNIPVQDGRDTKITTNIEKGVSSSSSPKKSTKLPPVCLRVDPLPGKKRSSRSPSPTNRVKSEDSTSENHKNQEKTKENEPSKGKYVSEEASGGKNMNLTQSGEEKCEVVEKKVEIEKEESRSVKKIWSEDEAAAKIQSVYRGYEVRKWDPLNKLKQIAKVKDQMAEIKRSIETLPTSSTEDKQRLVVGETIMNLLLKLDTIQGFHPSIRDIRKSVARQLVNLQEKLDTLSTKIPIEDLSTVSATSAAKNVEPLMVQEASNIEDEQAVHGEALESVQDTYGKLEDSTVLEEVVLPLQTEEPAPVEEGNVLKDHEELKSEPDIRLEEVQEKEVNQEVDGFVLKDEDSEEPKSEISIAGDDTAKEVLKEANVRSDVQPQETNEAVDESSVSEGDAGEGEAIEVEEVKGDKIVLPSRREELETEIPFITEENDEFLEEIKAECDVRFEEKSKEVGVSSVSEGGTIEADECVETIKFEELEIKIPLTGQRNDKVVLGHAEFDVHVEEAKGEADESSISEGEATKADQDFLFSNREPKIELLVTGEDADKIPGENNAEDAQLNEAQVKETGYRRDGIGETEKAQMHALQEDQMEPQLKMEFNQGEVFGRGVANEKLREENEKLKEMVEKLVEAGKDQLSAISNLSGKVKDLEKKLSKKKKVKARNRPRKLCTFNEQMVLNE